ncbi:MAG: hypothetical protein JXA99_12585 [Candidatus Lokiarchaeota archaeon]|nr:hypothetical protein [Candidatus Lokiarchaeota archaeon]
MSKKYEKKVNHIKENKKEHDQHHSNRGSSKIDIRNGSKFSVKKEKKNLKNMKKKLERSKKIW